jgi:hypothetical protein
MSKSINHGYIIYQSNVVHIQRLYYAIVANIFLYIYSIWAILEGWGAWNDQNIIRGLAHLSSANKKEIRQGIERPGDLKFS